MKPTSVDWTKNGLFSCITERSKQHENTSNSSVNINKPVSLDLGQSQLWNFIGNCCDMSQNDTIGKIELIPSIVLSSDNTKYKNDIQLFLQLFDESSVYRDYH